MKARTLLVGLMSFATPALALRGQAFAADLFVTKPPSFSVDVEMINLNIAVMDKKNQYVAGLKETDFQIIEDGIPQQVSLFHHEQLPISLVLMLDTSGSMTDKLKEAQSAAVRFVKTLGARDLAEVVQFNDRVEIVEDFTGNHDVLEEAIRRTRASGSTALHNALYVALKDLAKQKKARGRNARRDAIVVLTDGEDTASMVADDQVLDVARKSDTCIYSIQLRSDRASDRNRPEYSQATYFLQTVARESGGQAFFPAAISQLDSVYGRIADELRTQYSLGYVSSNARRDGAWRCIAVRVVRQGLQLRHKLGYYAPRN